MDILKIRYVYIILKSLVKRIGLGYFLLFCFVAKIYLFLLLIVNLANLVGTKYWISEIKPIEIPASHPSLFILSYPNVDKDLVPYVMFAEQLIEQKINYPVNFGKLSGSVVGLCINVPGIYTKIIIDENFWRKPSCYHAKEEVLLHEVGHCSLLRFHDKSLIFGKYTYGPSSIMYPNAFGCTNHYKDNRQHFLKELISK